MIYYTAIVYDILHCATPYDCGPMLAFTPQQTRAGEAGGVGAGGEEPAAEPESRGY